MTQQWFAAGKKGTLVRAEIEKSSAEVGDLKLGTKLTVVEEGKTSDGTARLRISAPLAGWLSRKLAVCHTVSDAPDPLSFGLCAGVARPGDLPAVGARRAVPEAFPKKTTVMRKDLAALAGKAGGVGDLYGLPIPRTPSEVKKFGSSWLTKCFHAAGTLDKANSVKRVVAATELPVHQGADCAGGAGRKMFLSVEYEIPDLAVLHTELFLKLPWEPDWHMRGELSLGMGDGDGLEIAAYLYLEDLLPCHVPKFYFGDISRATTNYVLITERVPYAARGTDPTTLPVGAVHAACGKYEDFSLDAPEEYYKCLMRCMGRIAAWDKRGRFDE